jgi:methylmalonyl-CoA/ethylmalonyl-CoA epimerase
MSQMDIEIDHIGIAVPSLDAPSYAFWKALGWPDEPSSENVHEQKVKVAMLPLKNAANIELLEPTDPTSTIANFLNKRGPGIHHICLRVKGIDGVLKKLKTAGIKLINETPVNGAHNCRVAFVHPSSTGGVLVELSEKKAK